MSKLLVPVVLLILLINFYLRFKIIKSYQALSKKNISVDPKIMLDKKKLAKFIELHHPEHHQDILNFKNQLRNLIYLAAGGLVIIVIIFLFVHF